MSSIASVSQQHAPPQKGSRLEFIDLLRGWAVFIMIETHVTNALLIQSYRETWWFDYLDFFNGLVAPSFLFCAGCGLWIAINRKWDDYVNFRKPLWKYLGRMLWILGVAYALHLPEFSMRYLLSAFTPADAETFFQIDILHTIVVTSVFAVGIILITRNKNILLWTSILLSVLLIVFAPIIWAAAQGGEFSVIVRNMLTETPRSYFPFVPWSAFVFIGIIATKLYMDAVDKARFFKRLFIIGLLATSVGIIFQLWYNPYPWQLWRSTPIFFAKRIGLVFIAFAALWRYTERTKTKPANKRFRLFLLFGRESLLVYTVHLIIVYGSVANRGIAAAYVQTFTPLQCLGVDAILIPIMVVMAFVWSYLKTNYLTTSKVIQYAIAAVFLFFLIINK